MWWVESIGNSRLHFDHSSRMVSGTRSSQPTFSSQSICRRILALMMVGEYHPNASNVFATSETRDLLVMHSTGGSSVTFTRKWSWEAFHSIPSVLVYWSESDNATVAWESLRSFGMRFNTEGSLELHFRNKNPPLLKRACISNCSFTASWLESAPPR